MIPVCAWSELVDQALAPAAPPGGNSRAPDVRCAAYRRRRVDRFEQGPAQRRQGLRAGRRRQGEVLVWALSRPFNRG
jgi:hypothetical protein